VIYPLEIPRSMFRAAETCARRENVTVNEWVLSTMAMDIERHENEIEMEKTRPELVQKIKDWGYIVTHHLDQEN
jgi:hypothetical protein